MNMIKDQGWESLENRRKKARVTILYKFSHNLIDVSTDEHLHAAKQRKKNAWQPPLQIQSSKSQERCF